MANVLTYDPSPENPEVLSEEEQDSLQVGEKLAEEKVKFSNFHFLNPLSTQPLMCRSQHDLLLIPML